MSELKKVETQFVADYTKLPEIPEHAGMWSDEDLHTWWEEATSLLLTAHLLQEFVKSRSTDYDILAKVLLDMHPHQQQNLWRLVLALADRMEDVRMDERNWDSHFLAQYIRNSPLRDLRYV